MSIIQGVIASMGKAAPPPPPPYYGTDFWFDPELATTGGSDGWWQFNGTATGQMSFSGNPTRDLYAFNDGTSTHVYAFDGANYMISPQLTTTGAWPDGSITVDMWFYPTVYGVTLLAELGQQVANDGYNYNMMEIDSSGYLWAKTYPSDPVSSPNTVVLNAWNHVYFFHDVQGSLRLELNGNLDGTHGINATNRGYSPSTDRFFCFATGGLGTNMAKGVNYFQGKIGTIHIYDTIQPSTYLNTKVKYLTPTLVLSLDAGNTNSYSGTGDTWTDTVSNIAFTLYNSPTYSTDNGGYLSFEPGSGQYAQSSTSLNLLTTWTVEVWHYYTGQVNGNACILSERFTAGFINYAIGALDQGSVSTGYYNGWHTTPAYTLTEGNWYHIVGVYDGVNVKLYINGSNSCQASSSVTMPLHSGGGINLMRRWDNPDYWGGRLSVVSIYDGVASDATIMSNYNSTKNRFPKAFSFVTAHGQDVSRDNNWPFSGDVMTVINYGGMPAIQTGWTVFDGTNTRTIVAGSGPLASGIFSQNSGLGFITSMQLDGPIDLAATSVTIYGVI